VSISLTDNDVTCTSNVCMIKTAVLGKSEREYSEEDVIICA